MKPSTGSFAALNRGRQKRLANEKNKNVREMNQIRMKLNSLIESLNTDDNIEKLKQGHTVSYYYST